MDEDGFSDVADVTEDGYDYSPDPSSVGMDPSDGNNSEELNSFVENLTQKQAYTTGRGATATNPYPESFFSQLFGADNVNYTNIIGSDRINEINDLRYNQAVGGMSNRTGKQYTANDYYIGQSTDMGTVKPIPSTTRDFMNFMPGGGIINAMTGQPGLPEFDPRYQEIMNEKAKSANDPTVFDGVTDFLKDQFGMGPKDSGASLAAGSLKEGQFGIPDDRSFDAFGNVKGSSLDTKDEFSSEKDPAGYHTVINPLTGQKQLRYNKNMPYEERADVSSIFNNIGNFTDKAVGPNGYPVFGDKNLRFKLGLDKNQIPGAKVEYKTNFFG